MKKSTEEKLAEWKLLLEEREKQNLTILEFCRRKNISLSQFYYYQELIKHPGKINTKSPKTLASSKVASTMAPVTIRPVAVPTEASPIRLILPYCHIRFMI